MKGFTTLETKSRFACKICFQRKKEFWLKPVSCRVVLVLGRWGKNFRSLLTAFSKPSQAFPKHFQSFTDVDGDGDVNDDDGDSGGSGGVGDVSDDDEEEEDDDNDDDDDE